MITQTGGLTLTLSVAYLSVLAHQRNRERQGHALRAQALAIQSFIDPIPQPLPPTRSEVAAAKRAEAIEVAKERWNDEVEHAVKWVQRTNWQDVREGLEDRIVALWEQAFGESIQDSAEKTKDGLATGASQAKDKATGVANILAAKAKGGLTRAQAEAEDFESKVKDKALQARLAAWSEAKRVEGEAQQKAKSALEKGRDKAIEVVGKGKDKAVEVVGKVKNAVGLTGVGTAPGHIDLLAMDPVQKALNQRFEQRGGDRRTVADVLKQRYTPIDKRDNTVLRGV